MVNAHIFGIVVSKFSYWEEPNPIVLLVIDKNSEVSLYCIVLSLGLVINLRMEDSRKSLLDFQEVT